MKALFLFFVGILICSLSIAQVPQSFQYQAVVRDVSGTALLNQTVGFQISIISGSMTGTVEYVETHTSSTNNFGIVTLLIGSGTPTQGVFSSIDWGINSYFVKVEADPTGGISYLDMGTTQLQSVPYALYAEKAGNIPLYNGSSGIDVTGTTITNLSPDQVISITSGTGVSVSGTYPNFTIDNISPDQQVTLTGTGATTVSGTYPDFTINSTDNNTTYTAGSGIDVTGTTITNASPDQPVSLTQGGATTITGTYPNFTISSTDLNTGTPGGDNKTVQFNNAGSFGGDTAMIWDNTNKRLGVGLTNPNGRMVIRGSALAPVTEPLFEVKDADGHTVFVVYPDSVHVYVKDGGAKANRGGFAVSGRNAAKAVTNNFLSVTPDSTYIFTGDTIAGFGVENLGTGGSSSYMHLTPQNYFIGHQSGDSITTGLYNSFVGYMSGKNTKNGLYNSFYGYQSGISNTSGSSNSFYGYQTGFSNTTGNKNIYIGYKSGFSAVSGNENTFVGNESGMLNTTGNMNSFLGSYTGRNNLTGSNNSFIGYKAGYLNSSGGWNVFLGNEAGYNNVDGNYNIFTGYYSGRANTSGSFNLFSGYYSGYLNTTGGYNVFLGYWAGKNITNSSDNTIIGAAAGANGSGGYAVTLVGASAGYNNAGDFNTFVGSASGSMNTTGRLNTYLGTHTGASNLTGEYNVCIGSSCGYSLTGSSNIMVGAWAGNQNIGNDNCFLGFQAGYQNKGSGNVFIGSNAGAYEPNCSNRLYLHNSFNDSTGVLIYGQFDTHWLRINNKAGIGRNPLSNALEVEGEASKTVAGNFIANSDKRIKTNITDIDNSLELISSLHPVKFKYTKEWMEKHPAIKDQYYYNYIAQEYGKVFPESLFESGEYIEGDSKEILQIDTYNAQVIAIKAIQDLLKRVEYLEKENAELKKIVSNEDLKAEVELLKSMINKTVNK